MLRFNQILDSPDKRPRKEKWAGIIIHHTGVGDRTEISESMWATLNKSIAQYLSTKDNNFVSCHYQVGRNGELTEIVNPDKFVAFHAGKSSFWHPEKREWVSNWNEYAIGIELVGDGNRFLYPPNQIDACAKLCAHLIHRFDSINPQCIVGHEVIAPGRKNDPGRLFPWRYFYQLIYEHLKMVHDEYFRD